MKKLTVFLLSSALLVACSEEESLEKKESELEEEEVTEVDAEIDKDFEDESMTEVEEPNDVPEISEVSKELKNLGGFMVEDSFVNKFGVEALENYLEIDEQLTYQNYDPVNGLENREGSSQEEVIAAIDSVIQDAVYDVVEDKDGKGEITSITIHYFDPNEPESEEENPEVMNYGDLSFIFSNGQLYLSNVAPGWFEMKMNDMPDAEEISKLTSADDLLDFENEKQFFTLGKIHFDNQELVQVMVPSEYKSEGESDILAMYLYFLEGKTAYVNYVPFMEASTNLPLHGALAMNEFLQYDGQQ